MPALHRPDRHRTIHLVIALLLTSAAIIFLAHPLQAERPPTIGVECSIDADSLRSFFRSRLPGVTSSMCQEILGRLKSARLLSIWRYAEGRSPLATFTFRVLDGPVDDSYVQLELSRRDAAPVNPWRQRWLSSADAIAQGDPSFAKAGTILAQAFGRLLSNQEDQIIEHLKTIPIAEARWLHPEPPPVLVSSLPWQKYEHLRSSLFRVSCTAPQDP